MKTGLLAVGKRDRPVTTTAVAAAASEQPKTQASCLSTRVLPGPGPRHTGLTSAAHLRFQHLLTRAATRPTPAALPAGQLHTVGGALAWTMAATTAALAMGEAQSAPRRARANWGWDQPAVTIPGHLRGQHGNPCTAGGRCVVVLCCALVGRCCSLHQFLVFCSGGRWREQLVEGTNA